jgi:uncharacterized protein YciI
MVLDVESTEAARELLQRDPWIRTGRLEFELHPLAATPGILRVPRNLREQEWCYFGLFKREGGVPELPVDQREVIQRGHLANLDTMAGSGELVWAGPLLDDGPLRGILVFRDRDPEYLRERIARDPAVEAGRLGAEIWPWRIPRGTLPPPPS